MASTPLGARVAADRNRLSEFCHRWKITELAIFGSALREDFRADSDIDVLATFGRDARWSLLDQVRMESELAAIFQRKVDLVSRRAVEDSQNWIRREAIPEHCGAGVCLEMTRPSSTSLRPVV